MPDRRTTHRAKTIKSGTIVYHSGRCTVRCSILDLSPDGARLQPVDPSLVPPSFELRLTDGTTRQCVVTRRTGNLVGVRFLV